MIGTGVAIFVALIAIVERRTAVRDLENRRQAMVAELDRLEAAQAALHAATGSYAAVLSTRLDYRPAPDLLFQLHAVGGRGWRAVVGDSTLPVPPRACGIWVGEPALAPHRATTRSGVPACW